MRKTWIALALTCGVSAAAALSFARVHMPASNAVLPYDVNVVAYYRYGVVPDAIVFDIWSIEDRASPASVLGGFLTFAEMMKRRKFREVVLAYRGEARFVLDGKDFADIGRSYAWQSPLHLVSTLPERLRTPEGLPVYPKWSGASVSVLNEQMTDVNSFAGSWYLDDEVRRH